MIRQHAGQFLTGVYYEKYPNFTEYEEGRLFRFRKMSGHQAEQSIGNPNLEYNGNTIVISTTYQLPFKVRGYVLHGEKLYIINEITEDEIQAQAQSLLKNGAKRTNLTLVQVDNAKEVSRV